MEPAEPHPSATGQRSSIDDIIEIYKKDVGRSLLREALALTPDQRLRQLVELMRFTTIVRDAGQKAFR